MAHEPVHEDSQEEGLSLSVRLGLDREMEPRRPNDDDL